MTVVTYAPPGTALTRPVGPEIARCELTYLDRLPIDPARAAAQHAAYEQALDDAGWRVWRLPPAPDQPDGVFVEDTVVVLDAGAVLTRPGAASRRGEVASMEAALGEAAGGDEAGVGGAGVGGAAPARPVRHIEAPGTLDGGDVLRLGRTLWVGLGGRTNEEGLRQLAAAVEPWGYRVRPVAVDGCLHLKTAVTAAAADLVVVNPAWVPPPLFEGYEVVEVHGDEPFAANVLALGGTVLMARGAPRTRDRLEARLRERGVGLVEVAMDELAKAEAGVTCCSVLVGW